MSILTKIIDRVLPPLCVHCGREGDWLCIDAKKELAAEPLGINSISIPGVDCCLVRGSYDCEPLAQLIQKLKYHYWTGLTTAIVDVLKPMIPKIHVLRGTVIVPVPLHKRRQRERGFNQSLYLSRALSNLTGFPVRDILRRTRYTKPQAQLSADERLTNIIAAFGPATRVAKLPHSVILVDDVITTGSTIAECAVVLRQLGVRQITAVAIAKG